MSLGHQKKGIYDMKQIIMGLTVLFLCCAMSLTSCSEREPNDQTATHKKAEASSLYYGFYPSSKGAEFKLFRHNIFSFEVDIPQNWTFGVAGKAPGQVIMMYPEAVNTGKFAPSYETISVGIIPIPNVTLVKAYEYTLLGMKQSHKGLKIIQENTNVEINNNKVINFIYTWPSKTGNTIKENVFLIEYGKRIYSITTRTIDPISGNQKKTHEGIVNAFKPIKPVQF